MSQPDACIVHITDAEGNTLGTGFLVSTDGRIATCHHVVEGTEPRVAFPGGEPRPAKVVATDPTHDVAILRLAGELPPGTEPARLSRSAEGHYSDFRSRGYRPLGEMQGIPAEGRVLHAVSECPGVRCLPLILKSQDIRKGMSGAPVYIPDLGLIVGMITGYWDSLQAETGFRDAETGFAVPSEAIVFLCPDIPIHEPPPKLRRPALGVPFQAPVVPRYFVPRPEVSNQLKAQLLADEALAPGALVVSAVHGLGGIGKTTLVAALAHDHDLQARFHDGLLWATLGQQPDVLSLLVGWIQALRDFDSRPTTVESASNHLRTLLHDKTCLLVVDDAWQADHVRPFLLGGDRCRVLVTTRDATLARKVGARLYDLDMMTEGQTLALFEARLGLLGSNRETAQALAKELGYLPLALELAAAQVEAGVSWDELLNTFRQELVELKALELNEATYCNESLRLSFRLSLERLSPDDYDAFAWLGVLPEHARLSPAMAATLWDHSETDARKQLRRLRDKALLQAVGSDQYTIHDLLHDEAKLRLVERMPLSEAHATLLERYRVRTRDHLWHTLPNDAYIHEHLTWHMEQAGQIKSIHGLLQEEMSDGRNGWYQACEQLRQARGYLNDVRRAWTLAEKEYGVQSLPSTIGYQCRYALYTASINSLSRDLPGALLVGLVANNLWTPADGVAYATLAMNSVDRAQALAGLAPYLSESLWPHALVAVGKIDDRYLRTCTMAAMLPYLPEDCKQDESENALSVARAIEDRQYRAQALSRLARHVPQRLQDKVLTEALAAAHEIGNIYSMNRDQILCELLCTMAQLGHPEQALAQTRFMTYDLWRMKALACIVPHLSGTRLEEALGQLRNCEDVSTRIEAITSVLPSLPETLQKEIIEEAWAAARAIGHSDDRVEAFAELAPHLPAELLDEALSAARKIRNRKSRVLALAILLPHLSDMLQGEVLAEAWASARAIQDDDDTLEVLARLAPHVSAELLDETLSVAANIKSDAVRAKALTCLLPDLPPSLKEDVLEEIMELALKLEPDGQFDTNTITLTSIAIWLANSGYPKEAWQTARAIADPGVRNATIQELGFHVPVEALRQALEQARVIDDKDDRTWTLVMLSRRLPITLVEEAMTAARTIQDFQYRVDALQQLAQLLPAERRADIQQELQGACAEADIAESEQLRWTIQKMKWLRRKIALAEGKSFVDLLEREAHEERLDLSNQIVEEMYAPVRGIYEAADEAVHMAEKGRCDEALSAARRLSWRPLRREILERLIPYLVQLPRRDLLRLWQETLPVLAARSRQDLLSDFQGLEPVITALGGIEAVAETFCAIQDVGRWWP